MLGRFTLWKPEDGHLITVWQFDLHIFFLPLLRVTAEGLWFASRRTNTFYKESLLGVLAVHAP